MASQSPNPKWDRWIFASIAKHFETTVPALFLYVEGAPRKTNDQEDFFEVRVDGPFYTQRTRGEWYVRVEINCLLSTTLGDKKNYQTHRVNAGLVVAGFTHVITVLKYGPDVEDDESQLGCLQIDNADDKIITSHFGQIEPDVELQQATIEAHYEMDLTQ